MRCASIDRNSAAGRNRCDFLQSYEVLPTTTRWLRALFFSLYQAEEKYERRESRAEDLDAINQLKALVREREEQIQKLIVSQG